MGTCVCTDLLLKATGVMMSVCYGWSGQGSRAGSCEVQEFPLRILCGVIIISNWAPVTF